MTPELLCRFSPQNYQHHFHGRSNSISPVNSASKERGAGVVHILDFSDASRIYIYYTI